MDKRTALKLAELNNRFYRENAQSFSGTRQSGWPGWSRAFGQVGVPRSVLDVACGNARFKAFLDERSDATPYDYHAIDSCPDLLPDELQELFQRTGLPHSGSQGPFQRTDFPPANLKESFRCSDLPPSGPRGSLWHSDLSPHLRGSFQCVDIVSALIEGRDLLREVTAPACDLVVCFGFMHHVPTSSARHALLDFLVKKTMPGGHVVVSFWQFARDERMRAKAQYVTEQGAAALGLRLDTGDYLLGWNDLPNVYRYCHSFTNEELDGFAESVEDVATVVDRFAADGKTGNMNSYLIFRRK